MNVLPTQLSALTECATILLDSLILVLATPDMWTTEVDRRVLVRFMKFNSANYMKATKII